MCLQSLLRYTLFIIRTDHQNLLFIKETSKPMIVKWCMAFSEFSFKLWVSLEVSIITLQMLCLIFVEINKIDSPEEYSNSRILPVISRSFKPRDILYSKIGKLHNSRVGHFGVERILKRFLAQNDTWKYQRQHVKWFIVSWKRYYLDCVCKSRGRVSQDSSLAVDLLSYVYFRRLK